MGRRVCRIRASSSTTTLWGTGFLVGPGSILTNCHVVRHVVGQPNPDVTFQFDYRVRPDGSTSDGVTLGPNTGGDGWLVCSSPHSKYDLEVAPTGLPTDEELDYALVRIAGEPGTERGWVDITSAPSAAPDQSLAILQHPDKAPLKLALDTKAILALNGNQTRVTYRTNTIGGSSGSPCFNMDWQPVALHHSGDPAAPDFPATRNQGIPFGAITKHVARHARPGHCPAGEAHQRTKEAARHGPARRLSREADLRRFVRDGFSKEIMSSLARTTASARSSTRSSKKPIRFRWLGQRVGDQARRGQAEKRGRAAVDNRVAGHRPRRCAAWRNGGRDENGASSGLLCELHQRIGVGRSGSPGIWRTPAIPWWCRHGTSPG